MGTRLILNPTAGAGRSYRRLMRSVDRIHSTWAGVETCVSRCAEHVTELAQEAGHMGYERVLVAGGDGTVHFAANGLVHSETALGIVPVGTGNDIADSVGLPKVDVDAAIDVLAQGCVQTMDLGQVANRVFCCVLGVGMDTMALEAINASRIRRGRLLYSYATFRTMFRYRPQVVHIRHDAGDFHGPIMFAAVTNTRSYAGGLPIAPEARVDDGMLDLCVFPEGTSSDCTSRSHFLPAALELIVRGEQRGLCDSLKPRQNRRTHERRRDAGAGRDRRSMGRLSPLW